MRTAIIILILYYPFNLGSINEHNEMILIKGNSQIPSFYLDKREVTISEFSIFIEETGYVTYCEKNESGLVFDPFYRMVEGVNWRHDIKGKLIPAEDYEYLPVTRITMTDAMSYAKWAGKRLPTKEEWIFAAKGGNASRNYKYIGGNNPRNSNWFDNNSREKRKPVAQLKPNELGLFDMGGNVSELVTQENDSISEWLGGSFFEDKDFSELENLHNGWSGPKDTFHIPFSGFRCAKDL